jgi:hypothetical protein
LWPTPAAHEPGWKHIEIEDKSGNDPKHWNQRFYDKKTGRVVQKGLTQIARMWPTPQARDHFPPHTPEYIAEKKAQGHGMRNLNDEVNLWPTPTARDWKDGTAASCANVPTNGLQSHGINVVEGSLNPEWVGILMGYPPNWTDLSEADPNSGTETGSAASRESPKECQTVQTD